MVSQIKQKGFTIVELLIVIVVIGILAAISIVAYNSVTQKARDDQRISDARNIINAAAAYQAENGTWPSAAQVKASTSTVVLSGTASDRIGQASGSIAAAPSEAQKDSHYGYKQCADGVRVYFFLEGKTPKGPDSVVTGTCAP